jgi:hypothetical protein
MRIYLQIHFIRRDLPFTPWVIPEHMVSRHNSHSVVPQTLFLDRGDGLDSDRDSASIIQGLELLYPAFENFAGLTQTQVFALMTREGR